MIPVFCCPHRKTETLMKYSLENKELGAVTLEHCTDKLKCIEPICLRVHLTAAPSHAFCRLYNPQGKSTYDTWLWRTSTLYIPVSADSGYGNNQQARFSSPTLQAHARGSLRGRWWNPFGIFQWAAWKLLGFVQRAACKVLPAGSMGWVMQNFCNSVRSPLCATLVRWFHYL